MGHGASVGVLWVLLGAFAFSFVIASGKLAGGDHSTLQIVFLRYAGGLLTVLALVLTRGMGQATFVSHHLPAHALRALFGAGGVGCSRYAATHMPLAGAAALA